MGKPSSGTVIPSTARRKGKPATGSPEGDEKSHKDNPQAVLDWGRRRKAMKKLSLVLVLAALLSASAAKPPAHGCVCLAFMAGYHGAKALGADRLGEWIGTRVYEFTH